jgi:predicted metal-dependent phosphoesterase TrpH
MLRADLHVHSCHSGLNGNLAFLRSRDCYSEPEAVYRRAHARGMDLVTITDHDSIDGCLELLRLHSGARDIFIGEEVSCRWPDAELDVHVAVYGHNEGDHCELQRLRANVHEVLEYLRVRHILGVVNHPFHFYTGQVPLAEYVELLARAGALEVRNGAMLPAQNELVRGIVTSMNSGGRRVGMVGGSDAHTLRRVGCTWTAAPGTTREEFLASLMKGAGEAGGRHGSSRSLTADVYGVVAGYWKSLAGLTRHTYSPPRRALGLAFSAASLPFQFTPALVASVQKSREAVRCREYARVLLGADDVPARTTAGRRNA